MPYRFTLRFKKQALLDLVLALISASAFAQTCTPPPNFVDTPHPAVVPIEQMASHTEEITIARPLAVVLEAVDKPLKDTFKKSDSLPTVSGEYQLTKSEFGTPGSRRLTCLTDGSSLEEEVLESDRESSSYRFRYIVWKYTTEKARPIEYGVGDFHYLQTNDGNTHITWIYSFKLKRHEFPGNLGFLGRWLFRKYFLEREYADLMRGVLNGYKADAEQNAGTSVDDSVPAYLTPFMLIGMTSVIAVLLIGLGRALIRTTWPTSHRTTALWSLSLLIGGWFIVAAVTSIAGLYRPSSGPPTIQYGLLTPIVLGVLLFRTWPLLRRIVASVPNTWLVGVQFYRILGVIFVVLYAGRHLPGIFALPAGLGDSLVGLLAPFVAARFAHSPAESVPRVRLWNLLGIADLVIAVTLGFLTSPSPLQVAAFDRPSGLVAMFPLSLIPVFAVPLSILLHIASLQKLRQEKLTDHGELRTETMGIAG